MWKFNFMWRYLKNILNMCVLIFKSQAQGRRNGGGGGGRFEEAPLEDFNLITHFIFSPASFQIRLGKTVFPIFVRSGPCKYFWNWLFYIKITKDCKDKKCQRSLHTFPIPYHHSLLNCQACLSHFLQLFQMFSTLQDKIVCSFVS